MAIFFETIDISFPDIKRKEIALWIKKIIKLHGKKAGDIAYIFCSDAEILRINQTFLKHNYYTDIITFDYSEDNTISGDLFVSLDTVKSNSQRFKTDYMNELLRVMIHGILHLSGFNDLTLLQKQTIRMKEEEALEIWTKTFIK